MKLFLDSSVLLSACASGKGASRFVVTEAAGLHWELVSAEYCREETLQNLHKLGTSAAYYFRENLKRRIQWHADTLTAAEIVVFDKGKDRPVLLSALSIKPNALLTLDRKDFHDRLGSQFYGISIRTPGEWLMEQRREGRI